MNRTISYEEHFVQVQFYQQFIKDKEKEVQQLRNKLKNEQSLNECLKAKLEVSQKNRITL
jgi:predicted RNase H-like nuclease (RuvC/YqgF family)